MKRAVIPASSMLLLFAAAAAAQFNQWSAPVNLGPEINTEYDDSCPTLSKNRLHMYFASTRPGGPGGWDLYVSKRAGVNDPWGKPELVPNVNSSVQDSCPALSVDEYRLYFVSARSGGCGGMDLYVSRRSDRKDDFGWGEPVNLGCEVNSPRNDYMPSLFEDENGTEVMYFTSNRDGGSGGEDIYQSRTREDETFGPPTLVAELSTEFADNGPAVRRDGLEVIFASNRQGGLGSADLWGATRLSTDDPWSAPENLTVLNSEYFEGNKISFTFDGRQLYFRSTRPGGYGSGDLYVATRDKLRPQPGGPPMSQSVKDRLKHAPLQD